MTAAAILADAMRAGLTIAAKDGRLSVTPASRLTTDLRDLLVLHRAEILTLIAANEATPRFRVWRVRFTSGDRCTAVHPSPVTAAEARADALEQFGAGRVAGIEPT